MADTNKDRADAAAAEATRKAEAETARKAQAARDAEASRQAAEDEAQAAADAAQTEAAKATEEARKQSIETLTAQEEMRPYPSQEEADRIKTAAATGAAPYATRQLKP